MIVVSEYRRDAFAKIVRCVDGRMRISHGRFRMVIMEYRWDAFAKIMRVFYWENADVHTCAAPPGLSPICDTFFLRVSSLRDSHANEYSPRGATSLEKMRMKKTSPGGAAHVSINTHSSSAIFNFQ